MTWVCSLQKKSPVFSALIFRNSSKLSSKASSRTFANASFLLPLVTWRRHGKCHGKYDNLGPWITYQNCDCSIANCTNCQKGLVLSNPKRVILTRIYLLVYPKLTSQFSKFRWSHNPFAKYMNRHFNWIILVVFFWLVTWSANGNGINFLLFLVNFYDIQWLFLVTIHTFQAPEFVLALLRRVASLCCLVTRLRLVSQRGAPKI
jgi:hypothetical protein